MRGSFGQALTSNDKKRSNPKMIGSVGNSVALQMTITAIAICGALVPISMSIGILAWGGTDRIIILFLIVSVIAICGLLFKVVTARSRRIVFQQIGFVSACAIAVITLVYSLEFLLFRIPGQRLTEPVPVFGLSVPLIAMYGFSLFSSSLEAFFTFQKIQQQKFPR